jgi:Flp pilus assembly protein TadG
MMRCTARNERGSVTVFIVIIFSALVLLAGLVIDGGYSLAAKMRAISIADGAARAGAQAMQANLYREKGDVQFDAYAVTSAGDQYLEDNGVAGSVEIENGVVVARTEVPQTMSILGLVGIGPFTLTGEGRSRLIQGVRAPAS